MSRAQGECRQPPPGAPTALAQERAALGAALQDEQAAKALVESVRPSEYSTTHHAWIHTAIESLLLSGGHVDYLTVAGALKEHGHLQEIGSACLVDLVDQTPTPSHHSDYIGSLKRAARARCVKEACARAATEIGADGADPAGVVADLWERLRDVQGEATQSTAPSPFDGRFTKPLSHLLAVPDEPVSFLVDRLLVAGANGWIGGEPKSLKSWLALYLGLCIALGVPVFGRYIVPAPARVLYVQEEDGERRVRRRIRRILAGLRADPPKDEFFRYSIKAGLLFDDERWMKALRSELEDFQPALVVCDVFELMHTKDSNARAELKPILYRLDRLREEFACGFWLVDHFKKSTIGGSKRGGQRLSGSVGKHAWGESSIYLFPGLRKDQVRLETELKDSPSETFSFTLEGNDPDPVIFTWEAEKDERAAEMKAKILEVLSSLTVAGEWVPAKLVAEAAGVATNTAMRWLNLLVDEDGKLERERRQVGKVKPWHWRLRA